MDLRCLLLIASLSVFGRAKAMEPEEWLRDRLQLPSVGAVHWQVGFTTGHIPTDPLFHYACTKIAGNCLARSASSQDTVQVSSIETKVWNQTESGQVEIFLDKVPFSAAPNSRGGSDIEGAAQMLASTSNSLSPVVIFSAGPSQVPREPSQVNLTGGNGKITGYDGPFRLLLPEREELPSSRRVLITVYKPTQWKLEGSQPRNPIAEGLRRTESFSKAQLRQPPSQLSADGQGVFNLVPYVWIISCSFLGGLLGAIPLYLLGRRSGPKILTAAQESAEPTSDESLPQLLDESLNDLRVESKKLLRQLDMAIQDLHEAGASLTSAQQSTHVELRQEVARLRKDISVHDEVSADFLAAIERTILHFRSVPQVEAEAVNLRTLYLRLLQRTGLDQIHPKTGDHFLPEQHSIDSIVPTPNVSQDGLISQTLSPGYRRGNCVMRQAQVTIFEHSNE